METVKRSAVRIVPKLTIITFYLFTSFFIGTNAYGTFLTSDEITKWADHLENRLIPELDKFTGIKNLEKSYDDLRKAKLVQVNGTDLVRKMSKDMTQNFEKKMAALERLVAAAEEAVKNYENNADIEIPDVKFMKMKNFSEDDVRLVYSKKFKKGVNYDYSGVHIPVEIYEGYPEILNGLQWSSALDTVFQYNSKNDPDLMWQYFGSQSGFMRTYPAHKWVILPRKPDFPDLYDVRLRPWYVHASSSPKDMMILMDSSGSMRGQTMEIMKIAVKTLLTTLGENDFVNVATFSNVTKWVTCFNTFVQANRRNKHILSKGIDEVEDGNIANLSLALDFAFKEFINFRDNKTEHWAGSECNQVIMIFSDGGTDETWEVLEKYNSNKTIRVFTYIVGPHPVPYATLKEIACQNRGIVIWDYVKVLGRTLVLAAEKNFQWTNFYLDAMGLGMMTTVTLPVFNRIEGGNQSMVGVMGVDITLQEMLDYEPSYEIGPAGYSFGINSNGFIVFHPNLKTDFEYIDDPPHLDFLEVEVESSEKNELRRSMIDLETSKKALTSLIKLPDGKHIIEHHMEYFYTPVKKTSFSIAVVMPTERSHYLLVEGMDFDEVLPLDGYEKEGIHLAPWKYCHGYVLNSNISAILVNLSNTFRNHPELCKIPLLQRLIWDIRKTEDIIHYWHTEQRDGKREGVIATFVQSEGGLTRIYPPREIHHLGDQTNPSRSFIYQRAFYGEDYVFIPPDGDYDDDTIGISSISHNDVIMIVKSVSFARSGITYRPAVVGVMMDPLWLQSYLISSSTGPVKLPVTCADEDIICYLVDDGGFVISTNRPDIWNVTGKFLGVVDSEIMTTLYERKVFLRNEDFNYEDRCKKTAEKRELKEEFTYTEHCQKPIEQDETSSGYRIKPLSFQNILTSFNIGWLFDLSAWSHLNYWIYSFFSSLLVPGSDALPEFFELPNETACNTHEAQYYIKRWDKSYSENITCSNCTRYYALARVGKMNIFLLVTTEPCAPDLPYLLQASEEMKSSAGSTCDRPLRYRRRPDKCYAYSIEENNTECGSVGRISASHSALLVELLFLLIMTFTFQKN